MTDYHLIDEKLTWRGSTDESSFPVAVLPTAHITKVMCTNGHVLCGLFVLFRPARVGTFAAQLGAATWQLGLTTHEEGWLEPADPMEFLTAELMLLGPWQFSEIVPDTYKLVPDQMYEFYFIQHPGLGTARRIADEIAAGSHPYGEPHRITVGQGEIRVPEQATSFIPRGGDLYSGRILYRRMPHAQCEGVSKQVQRLQAHLGAMRYLIGTSNFPYLPDVGLDIDTSGGVNDGIVDVRTMGAVYRFQKDANQHAAFKVNGNPHAAYVDASYDPVVDRAKLASLVAEAKAKRKAKAPGKKAPQAEQDAYKGVLEQARRLEEEATAEREDVNVAMGRANAWAYLDGDMISVSHGKELVADGVVDADTADTIKAWLDDTLRKPGMILVLTTDPREWNNWLRLDAAIALRAFHELAQAMGFSYGVCVNHAFRSAQVDIGQAKYGRSPRSIHKTGAAIDLGMIRYSETVEAFPVIYEHHTKDGRVSWRLYGATSQPISTAPGMVEECAKPLIEKLDALARAPDPLAHAFDALRSIAVRLAQEARSDPRQFFGTYYRNTVRRWNYDAFHPEGGTPGDPITADVETSRRIDQQNAKIAELQEREAELNAKLTDPANHDKLKELRAELGRTQRSIDREKGVRQKMDVLRSSFLDLTALAHACGLEPIHAYGSGWGQTTTSVKAADLPTLVKVLDTAAQSVAAHPEMKDVVVVARKTGSHKTPIGSIDKEFVASWADALKALQSEAPRSVKVNPPQIVVTLSHTDAKKADAAKVAGRLRGLGSKKLAGMLCVEGTPPVQAASDWARYIDARVTALDDAWRAMQTAPANTPAKKTPKVPSKKPPAQQSILVLQPIFMRVFQLAAGANVKDAVWFLPGDLVTVPAAGHPIGMEWWHFQLESALFPNENSTDETSKPKVLTRRLWADLLVEIGYERDVLRHGASPTLHYREGLGYPDADLDEAKAR